MEFFRQLLLATGRTGFDAVSVASLTGQQLILGSPLSSDGVIKIWGRVMLAQRGMIFTMMNQLQPSSGGLNPECVNFVPCSRPRTFIIDALTSALKDRGN